MAEFNYNPSGSGETTMGWITYEAYTHGGGTQNVTHDSGTVWNIHMPHQIESSVEASYADGSSALAKLGSIGSDIMKGISGLTSGNFDGKGMVESVKQHAAERGTTVGANLLGDMVEGSLLGKAFDISAEDVQNSVNKTMGSIPNPYLEQFFEGIGFRSFQFQHKLMAFEEKDTEIIHRMINAFKYHASPSLSKKGYRMTYPSQFNIRFNIGEDGERNKWLPIITRSVLENVEVNHTASDGWATFANGAPVDIELSLQFKEVQLVYKDHYASRAYPEG